MTRVHFIKTLFGVKR